MSHTFAQVLVQDLKPLLEDIISTCYEELTREIMNKQSAMSVEIHNVSDRLDGALNKIDIMIARSDARVDAIYHMVDNCLELSRTCSLATEEANKTVLNGCTTIHEDIALHKMIAEDHSANITELHSHIHELERLLNAERQERSSIHDAVSSIKQTIDVLIGSSARPNININHHKL